MEPTPPVSAFAEDDARLAGMHGYDPAVKVPMEKAAQPGHDAALAFILRRMKDAGVWDF